jgi:hypothetical protein
MRSGGIFASLDSKSLEHFRSRYGPTCLSFRSEAEESAFSRRSMVYTIAWNPRAATLPGFPLSSEIRRPSRFWKRPPSASKFI